MEFTAQNVAKYVAKAIIHGAVAKQVQNTIVNHTDFDKDSTTVEITSHVIGWYVSHKLKPVTDKMVDTTADYISEKRAKRTAKKTTKKEA
jgi:predicted transcriptional regulator